MILKHFNSQIRSSFVCPTILKPVFGFCDSPYKVPYNINRQQHLPYLKKVERAEQIIIQSQKINSIPRRQRRIWNRPRLDLDITNYTCFRLSNPEESFFKTHEHCLPVVTKISVQPKWLIHAFGRPNISKCNTQGATGEFTFQDLEIGMFLLYDYRMTTVYRDNIDGYDYENQSHIRPGMRLTNRLSYDQFWQSEKYYSFRVNATRYAFHVKFREWITREVEERKTRESYDEYIDKKFGVTHTFNLKSDAELFVKKQPLIRHAGPQHFTAGLSNVKKIESAEIKSVDKKKKKGKGKEAAPEFVEDQNTEQELKEAEVTKVAQKDLQKPNYPFAKKFDQEYRVSAEKGTQAFLNKVSAQG